MDLFCLVAPLTMLFDTVLSVATGIDGCEWPISFRAPKMDISFLQFSNSPTNYASVADAMNFLMILHSTCMGPFSRSITLISVLLMDFGTRKKTHLIFCVPLVLRCRMHLNICIG